MAMQQSHAFAAASPPAKRRPLPYRLLIGYTSNLEKVEAAVRNGVNVVVWAFIDIVAVNDEINDSDHRIQPKVVTHLNLTAVQECIQSLDRQGWQHVVHLASFGGWNGPHLDTRLSAQDWYRKGFRSQLGHIFHGLDWDLEGHDDLSSPTNEFSVDCLDKMVEISKMAQEDGYIVGMAPPQSYLDVAKSRSFSRRVNLTDHTREWHADFHYFGQNVYAYVLAKCSDAIDFISIQFYESYSRASMEVMLKNNQQATTTDYLIRYVQTLAALNWTHSVDFSSDPDLDEMTGTIHVPLPLDKLVWGFANGWALQNVEKVFFASPEQVSRAWFALAAQNLQPRGVMFWTIDEEGTNGVHLAKGLGSLVRGEDCEAE